MKRRFECVECHLKFVTFAELESHFKNSGHNKGFHDNFIDELLG